MFDEDIVISGISGRFPDSDNLDELRDNLFGHKDLITEDGRRWPPGLHGMLTRAGKIRDLSRFDAQFFGINSKQANHLDPQSRILLETTYEAIVDSGYNPECLRGRNIGIYIGESFNEFGDGIGNDYEGISSSSAIGTKRNMLANRLSYVFDFHGPSVVVDSACSSSLQALHLAYMTLKLGQIDMAIVGGANLNLKPGNAMKFYKYNMISKSGKCQFLDAGADGYARSEAVSVLLLQHRKDAKRVYATVLNVRTNSDGYKPKGITYPSLESQTLLMKTTLIEANIDPNSVDYIEAHGTGTQAGDQVEAEAIKQAYCSTGRNSALLVGSVKSNIGHSETASGMCSIAKVLLVFENNQIPANLHFSQPNPKISALFDGSIVPVLENTPYTGTTVAINSFGFGGSNVHLLLRSEPLNCFPSRKTNLACQKISSLSADGFPISRLVTFSGRTEASVDHIFDFIDKHSDRVSDEFFGLINELNRHKELHGMNCRGFMLYRNQLSNEQDGLFQSHRQFQEVLDYKRPVWFVLSGMGTQWKHMAEGLMEIELFANTIQKLSKHLKPFGVDLMELIISDQNNSLESISGSSLAITAIQIALVDILRQLDIDFDGMFGHSAGELVCAYVDNLIDAEQLILTTYIRGKCIEDMALPPSLMAAVGLNWSEALQRCPDGIFPACYNSKQSVTISGHKNKIQEFLAKLKTEKVFTKLVNSCGIGFHCPLMEPLKDVMIAKLDPLIPKRTRSAKWLSSSVPEEHWHNPETQYSSADYFVNNLLSPVLFEQCVRHIPKNAIVIEIAPDSLFRNILRKSIGPDMSYVGLMKRNSSRFDNLANLLSAIGQLHNLGLNPNIQNLYGQVSFPVPRGTQSIGALVKWNHSEQWLVTLYPKYFNKFSDVTIDANNVRNSVKNAIEINETNGTVCDALIDTSCNGVSKESDDNSRENGFTSCESKCYLTLINDILGVKNGTRIRENTKLHELGMDSLMTEEVKTVLDREFGSDFSFELLPHLSYGDLIGLKNSDHSDTILKL